MSEIKNRIDFVYIFGSGVPGADQRDPDLCRRPDPLGTCRQEGPGHRPPVGVTGTEKTDPRMRKTRPLLQGLLCAKNFMTYVHLVR